MAAQPPLVKRDITKEAAVPAKVGFLLIGIVDKALVPLDPTTILAGLDYSQLLNLPELGDLAAKDLPINRDPTLFFAGDGTFRSPPQGQTVIITDPGTGQPVPVPAQATWNNLGGEPSSSNALMTLLGNYAKAANANLTGTPKAASQSTESTGLEIVNAAMLLGMLSKVLDDASASQTKTYSSVRIVKAISDAITGIRNEIQGQTTAAEFNTFAKVTAALKNTDASQLPLVLDAMKNRVRVDAAQDLTQAQKDRGLANLGLDDLTTKLNRLLPAGGTPGQYPSPRLGGGYEWKSLPDTYLPVDPNEPDYQSAVMVLNAARVQLEQYIGAAETVVYTGPDPEDAVMGMAVTALNTASATLVNYTNQAEVF